MGATARIQSNQLSAVASQAGVGNEPQLNSGFNFELPVWHGQQLELVEFRLDRDHPAAREQVQQRTWNIRLRFDLDDLGTLVAFSSVRGKTVAASLWLSEQSAVPLVNRELTALSSQLQGMGMTIHSLQCQQGVPDESPTQATINLLEAQA